MRHPGAPSERELVDEVVRLRAINADLLAACEGAVDVLERLGGVHGGDGGRMDWALDTLDAAIARAKGEVGG